MKRNQMSKNFLWAPWRMDYITNSDKGKNIFIEKEDYEFAVGFNKTKKAIKLKVLFERNLETIINI